MRMLRHSTGETFDNYVRNVTNVQHKYTRSLPETSVVITYNLVYTLLYLACSVISSKVLSTANLCL